MSWFKKAWHSIKTVSRSPILKSVAGGLAIVFPAVGLPAMAAIVASNKALDLAEKGDAKARSLISNTVALAKQGHPDAVRAVKVLTLVKAQRRGDPKAHAWMARIQQQHNARQTAARRVAARYRVHPQTGRLVRSQAKPASSHPGNAIRKYA
jgi:hypothetical protein